MSAPKHRVPDFVKRDLAIASRSPLTRSQLRMLCEGTVGASASARASKAASARVWRATGPTTGGSGSIKDAHSAFHPHAQKPRDRDNAIDRYISDEWDDVLADGIWQTLLPKARGAHPPRKAGRGFEAHRCFAGQRAFFPFPDNTTARPAAGGQHRRAGRLHPATIW